MLRVRGDHAGLFTPKARFIQIAWSVITSTATTNATPNPIEMDVNADAKARC